MPPELENPPAPPVVPAAPPAPPNDPPAWLPGRLQQAAEARDKAWLKDLGVESPDLAKQLIAEGRAAAEAKKTAEQRHQETEAALTRTNAELATYKVAIDSRAAAEFAKLSESQQAAVSAIAGEDSAARLKAIAALSPTWVAEPPAPAPEPKKKPVAPPANSAPVAPAPKPGSDNVETDVLSQYTHLQTVNPVMAANFYMQNYSAISQALEQQS